MEIIIDMFRKICDFWMQTDYYYYMRLFNNPFYNICVYYVGNSVFIIKNSKQCVGKKK